METASSPRSSHEAVNQMTASTTVNLSKKNNNEPVALPAPAPPSKPSSVCFCPSRWLMAHHDPMANFSTFKSHLCFVDINHDGDYNLALIDIRFQPAGTNEDRQQQQQQQQHNTVANEAPYICTLKVYRGKRQVYSYRLADIPSSLNVTAESIRRMDFNLGESVLSMTLGSDIRIFHHFRPWRLLSLTDEHWKSSAIEEDKFNRLEYEAWDMAKKNQVDTDTLYELLSSLKKQSGSLDLTSHSINFLALTTKEDRLNYIEAWRNDSDFGSGSDQRQLMSQDTICCTCIFQKNDFHESDDQPCRSYLVLGTEDRHIIVYDINEESYIEHFNVPSTPNIIISDWKVFSDKSLEYKLIVSCRDCKLYQIVYPDTKFRSDIKRVRFDLNKILQPLIDNAAKPSSHSDGNKQQTFYSDSQQDIVSEMINNTIIINNNNSNTTCTTAVGTGPTTSTTATTTTRANNNDANKIGAEANTNDGVLIGILVQLNSFALDLTWFGQHQNKYLAVACVDRRVYCYNHLGCYMWSIREEMPITCLEAVTNFRMSVHLLAVASQSNRIDFYEIDGRIVDTIYLGQDYATVIRFGRYGREDNCLCIITRLGHLRMLILKRMAKFADGQCLSSAALAAASSNQQSASASTSPTTATNHTTIIASSSSLSSPSYENGDLNKQQELNLLSDHSQQQQQQQQHLDGTLLDDATNTKMLMQMMNMSATNQQTLQASSSIVNNDADGLPPQAASSSNSNDINSRILLKIPSKSHSFVKQVAEQADHALDIHRRFTMHMRTFKNQMIRDIIRGDPTITSGSRISLVKLKGLGPIYKLTLSIRLELCHLLRVNSTQQANNNNNNNKHPTQERPLEQQQQQVGQSPLVSGEPTESITSTSSSSAAAAAAQKDDSIDFFIQQQQHLTLAATQASNNSTGENSDKITHETMLKQLMSKTRNSSNKRAQQQQQQTIGSLQQHPTTTTTTSTTSVQQEISEGLSTTIIGLDERYDIMLLLFANSNYLELMPKSFKLGNIRCYQHEIDMMKRRRNNQQQTSTSSVLTSKISVTLRVSSQWANLDQLQSLKIYATVPAYQVPIHMCTIELPLSETSF